MEDIIFLKLIVTSLARIGMIVIHVGVIPSTNVNLIVVQHLLNIAVTTTCYLSLGYGLSWAEDLKNLSDPWLFNGTNEYIPGILEGWKNMILGEGIISLSIAGKIHFIPDLVIIFFLSLIGQPLMTNIITEGTNLNEYIKKAFNFEDPRKIAVIQTFPSGFALGATAIFGRRIVNMNDMDLNSIPINAQTTVTLGYFLIIIGYFDSSFNPLFALSCGMLATISLLTLTQNVMDYWVAVWMLQGTLSAVLSSLGLEKAYEVVLVAALGTMTYMISAKAIRSTTLDDYSNIFAVHGVAGSFPLVVNPLFVGLHIGRGIQRAVAGATFAVIIFLIGLFMAILILLPFKIFGLLRNSSEQELYNKKWPKTKLKGRQRSNIQPGAHTIIKFKRYINSDKGHYERRTAQSHNSQPEHNKD